jgi:hypothetical protein
LNDRSWKKYSSVCIWQPAPAVDKSVDYCIFPRELVLPKYETMNNSSWNIYVRSKKSFPLRYLEIIVTSQWVGGSSKLCIRSMFLDLVLGAEKDAIFLSERRPPAKGHISLDTSLFP